MWVCPKCKETIEDQFDSCWKCAGTIQKPMPSKKSVWPFIIVVLVLVQLFFVLQLTLRPVNLAKIPFRMQERGAVFSAFAKNPSPENKAELQKEWQLAGNHVVCQQYTTAGIVFAALLGAEMIVVLLVKQRNKEDNTKD